jgi:hypothetical protein
MLQQQTDRDLDYLSRASAVGGIGTLH